MIKTSYFRVASDLTNSMSVYLKTPPWYCMGVATELCADKNLYMARKKHKITEEEFIQEYVENTLIKLDPYLILKKYDGKVLLGWATPDKFDCRKVIASWIRLKTGIIISELTKEELTKGALLFND